MGSTTTSTSVVANGERSAERQSHDQWARQTAGAQRAAWRAKYAAQTTNRQTLAAAASPIALLPESAATTTDWWATEEEEAEGPFRLESPAAPGRAATQVFRRNHAAEAIAVGRDASASSSLQIAFSRSNSSTRREAMHFGDGDGDDDESLVDSAATTSANPLSSANNDYAKSEEANARVLSPRSAGEMTPLSSSSPANLPVVDVAN